MGKYAQLLPRTLITKTTQGLAIEMTKVPHFTNRMTHQNLLQATQTNKNQNMKTTHGSLAVRMGKKE